MKDEKQIDLEEKKTSGKKHGSKKFHDKKYDKSKKSGFVEGVNSPTFWNRVPGLLESAGRIPSTMPMNLEATGYGAKFYDTANNKQQYQIAVIEWIPSVGRATGSLMDPINTAAQQLFTYIRQSVSGSRTYEAADVIQYIISVYNAHLAYHYLRLIYGLTNIVSPLNRDLARAAIEGIGYDYDNIVAHKADLLFYLNNYAYKLSQFPVPAGWSCLEHWKLLLSGLFSDRYVDSLKNQFYLFSPIMLYRYDWANAQLVLTSLSSAMQRDNFTGLLTATDTFITSLTNNSDVQQMGADILRVFDGHLEPVETTPIDYTSRINITTNEMLNQIRNLEFFELVDGTHFTLGQSGSSTLYYPVPASSKPVVRSKRTVYFLNDPTSFWNTRYGKGKALIGYEKEMTPEAIIVASRMMAHIEPAYDSSQRNYMHYTLESWGVEVFTGITFIKTTVNGICDSYTWESNIVPTTDGLTIANIEAIRSEFEGAPKLIFLRMQQATSNYDVVDSKDFFDLDNFILVANELLDDLHYCAVQSAFYVPLATTKKI